eukprot:4667286-Amphidinium_carterae.1
MLEFFMCCFGSLIVECCVWLEQSGTNCQFKPKRFHGNSKIAHAKITPARTSLLSVKLTQVRKKSTNEHLTIPGFEGVVQRVVFDACPTLLKHRCHSEVLGRLLGAFSCNC